MKKLIWLFFYILSLVGISFYGGRAVYGFHFAVLMFPLICALYLLYVYFNFRIYQKVEGRSRAAGHPTEYYMSLQNESIFAFSSVKIILYSDFSTITGLSGDLRFELMPHTGISRESVLVCKYRGHYNVGIKELVIEDFFGFFKFRYSCDEQTDLWVKPDIIYLDGLRSSDVLSVTARDQMVNKTERDVLTRKYSAGDPVKDINWKASARTGELLVRTRIGEERQGVTIIMDSKRYSDKIAEYLPLENKVIETVIALTCYFEKHNIPVNVVMLNNVKPVFLTVNDTNGFNRLYNVLSDIQFRDDNAASVLFAETAKQGVVYDSKMCYMVLCEKSPESERFCDSLRLNCVNFVNYIVTDVLIKESKEDIRVSPYASLKEVL